MSRGRASCLLKNVRISRVGKHLGRSGKDDNEPQEPNIRKIRRIMGPVPRIIRILSMFMTRVGHMRQEPRSHDHTCFTRVEAGSAVPRRALAYLGVTNRAHVNNTMLANMCGLTVGKRSFSTLDAVYPQIESLRLRKLSI